MLLCYNCPEITSSTHSSSSVSHALIYLVQYHAEQLHPLFLLVRAGNLMKSFPHITLSHRLRAASRKRALGIGFTSFFCVFFCWLVVVVGVCVCWGGRARLLHGGLADLIRAQRFHAHTNWQSNPNASCRLPVVIAPGEMSPNNNMIQNLHRTRCVRDAQYAV